MILGRSALTLFLVQHALAFSRNTIVGTHCETKQMECITPHSGFRFRRQVNTALAVTIDSSSSSTDLDESTDDEYHENDPTKYTQSHHSISNGKRKPKRHNKAMGDTAFLRKRTTDLLRITSQEFLAKPGEHEASLGGRMKVGKKTFNFLIDAWAFSGELDAADQALQLINRMEELQDLPEYVALTPDVRSYTKVINALSRSMRTDAGEVAEEILNKMEFLSASGTNPTAKPNTFTYTATIEAHANSGSDDAPRKAEEILDRMIAQYQSGDPDVKPTSRSFNAAITAYGKSGVPGAAQIAEDLFLRMEGLYMSGVEEAKPNTFNYNSLITAWGNSGEEGSAQRAANVLERMEQCYAAGDPDCRPTTVSFNAVIDAYAKSGEEFSASRAEGVLRHMEDLYESGEEVQPNTRSFNSVLNAYAKSGDMDGAIKAQDLLVFMTDLYQRGNEAVRPDAHSYCTVINAWARSHLPGKAERANNLFRNMLNSHRNGNEGLRPNVVAVNAVMNACAYTSGDVMEQNRAMEIAHAQMKELESSDYGSPDHVTYGTFLKVCANQMPDCNTRQQIIDVVFQKCIHDGQVGNLVLQEMKLMGPPELYQRLVGRDISEEIKMEDLPAEWWSNVVEGKWRRRRNF